MPNYEVYLPKTFNKNSVIKFNYSFQYGFESKSENYYSGDFESELEVLNEAFTKSGEFKVLTFEMSDLASNEKIYAGFSKALGGINPKHRENVYVRAYFDQTNEDEYYSFIGESFKIFYTVEEIEDYKDMLASKQKIAEGERARRKAKRASKVARKILESRIEKYAIVRIKIELKNHEPFIRKAFDEILENCELSEKDSTFSTLMDSVINSGETYFDDYSGNWRDGLQYHKGKIGELDFLNSIVEYDLSRKFLKLLISNAPHKRRKYLPIIWGFFGIFGEKVAIRVWSKKPNQTRILWNYEDNIMGPTKEGVLEYDDWNFTNLKSLNCNYYDWNW